MNRLLAVFLFGFLAATVLPAGENDGFVTRDDLIGRSFALESLDGKTWTGDRAPTLKFNDGMMLSGRVCNNFRGRGELSEGVLTMQQAASTRMLCLDQGLSELENRFFRLMGDGVKAVLAGDRLVLAGGDTLMVFADAAASGPGVSAAALSGKKFVLKTFAGEAFAVAEPPTIAFENSPEGLRISGTACNNFFGPAEIIDGVRLVSSPASTMKLCVDAQLNKFEGVFHRLLQNGARIRYKDGILSLEGEGLALEYEEVM